MSDNNLTPEDIVNGLHSIRNNAAATYDRKMASSAIEFITKLQRAVSDRDEVLADKRRLTRELDMLLNGEAGAAKQASLCDIVGQVQRERIRSPQRSPEPIAQSPEQIIADIKPEALVCSWCGRAGHRSALAMHCIQVLRGELSDRDSRIAMLERQLSHSCSDHRSDPEFGGCPIVSQRPAEPSAPPHCPSCSCECPHTKMAKNKDGYMQCNHCGLVDWKEVNTKPAETTQIEKAPLETVGVIGACTECGYPRAECVASWPKQRKCCPDCSHALETGESK